MPLKLTRVLLVSGFTSLMQTLPLCKGVKLTMLSIGGVAFQNGFVKEKKKSWINFGYQVKTFHD